MTFIGVGIMASIAVAGLYFGIPRGIDRSLSVPSIRERLSVVRKAPLLTGFLITTLWATGAYTVYTYLASYLTTVTRLDGAFVGIAFFVWGVSAVVGLFLGGTLSDRFGSRAVMIPAFTFLTLSFLGLSATGHYLSGTTALAPITARPASAVIAVPERRPTLPIPRSLLLLQSGAGPLTSFSATCGERRGIADVRFDSLRCQEKALDSPSTPGSSGGTGMVLS